MSKLICSLSFLVLCGLSHFDKTPDLAGASIRLAVAMVFSAALISLVRKEFSELLG